jgi:hypothetical protein
MSAEAAGPLRTRREHAAVISAALVKGVESAIEAGKCLAIAQSELDRPEFLAMLREDLHITEGTASKLKSIASHPVLSQLSHGKALPPNWSVLYALTQVRQARLISAIESGDIHPDMERKDVRALLPAPEQRDDDLPPNYEGSAEPEAETAAPANEDESGDVEGAREHDKDHLIRLARRLAEEVRLAQIKITGLESENEELRAERDQLRARVAELESVLATSGAVHGEKPKRGRGRPKGSPNKPKARPIDDGGIPESAEAA